MTTSREFKRFAKTVLKYTVPEIRQSVYFVAIAPEEDAIADVRYAVEIGFAILLDKPLVVVAPKGRHVAERLLRIADHIIVADIETESGRVEIAKQLKGYLNQ